MLSSHHTWRGIRNKNDLNFNALIVVLHSLGALFLANSTFSHLGDKTYVSFVSAASAIMAWLVVLLSLPKNFASYLISALIVFFSHTALIISLIYMDYLPKSDLTYLIRTFEGPFLVFLCGTLVIAAIAAQKKTNAFKNDPD